MKVNAALVNFAQNCQVIHSLMPPQPYLVRSLGGSEGVMPYRVNPLVSAAFIGSLAAARVQRRGCLFCRRRTPHRGAHREVDAVNFRHFGLPRREHPLGIMRLDPALEETGRNRQTNAFILHAFEVHARKPARINVFSNARPKPALNPRPAILFNICHCLITFLKE